MAKKTAKNAKFNLMNELHERTMNVANVTKSGQIKIKKAELKKAIEEVFTEAGKMAAKGIRVRFPVIGALTMKPVKARKAGKGVNPFTGEPTTIKARPESRKPRWSFPKSMKETFANKKNW